jgi:ribosomal protein L11 methylase PrmA
MTAAVRRWLVSGAADALEVALARCQVAAELRGVLELDGAFEAWIAGPLPPLPAGVHAAELPAEDCVASGLEDDTAIVLARDLVVRPPWVARPVGFAGIDLVVPRGGAFGSGEHASTQAALLALHACWQPVESAADVGTGSGILALYARARGCAAIFACDVDAAAVRAARALLPGAVVVEGGPSALPRPVDTLIANLAAAELAACLDDCLAAWNRRGPCVLSGLRTSEVAALVARLPQPPSLRVERAGFVALVIAPAAGRYERTR